MVTHKSTKESLGNKTPSSQYSQTEKPQKKSLTLNENNGECDPLSHTQCKLKGFTCANCPYSPDLD